jgi:photosystem II stability/assembly factor-like uncharacterized protein
LRVVVFLILTLGVLLALVVGCVPATSAPPATAIPTQAKSAGPWQVVLQKEIEHPIRVAAFFNESFGLTGGPSDVGQAYLTTDGGDTWIKTENSADCLFSLDIVDSQVAWQCSLGPVRVSTDGAQTWQAVTDYSNYCRQLSFLDAETGWLAASNQLGITTNGGQTWEAIPLPEGVQDIAAISLRTVTEGYLLDINGVFYTTPDGGQSWSSHSLDLGNSTLLNHETASAAIRFSDADHGVMALNLASEGESKIIVLRTVDGGQTWAPENVMTTAPLLVSLYLSRDGSTLTVADKMKYQITVLRYLEQN